MRTNEIKRVTVKIDTGHAAFADCPLTEIARILADTAADIQAGRIDNHSLRDINGNACGQVHFEEGGDSMAQTSRAEVEAAFDRLCAALEKSQEVWITQPNGKYISTIGAYQLSAHPLYGRGYVIEEIVNENGGTRQPFGYERISGQEFVRAVQFALGVLQEAAR
jgi:hypothetical protein